MERKVNSQQSTVERKSEEKERVHHREHRGRREEKAHRELGYIPAASDAGGSDGGATV
jgi:hypothetical protein